MIIYISERIQTGSIADHLSAIIPRNGKTQNHWVYSFLMSFLSMWLMILASVFHTQELWQGC